MIKNKILIVLFLFLLLIPKKILSDSLNVFDSTFSNYKDELLLINKIPIGITYEEVKDVFPNISELRAEGRNLYDAKVDLCILNNKAKIEFNFKAYKNNNMLYSYYYFIDSLDSDIADSLYLLLKNFYKEHYGNSSEGKELDPAGFYNITSFWRTKEFSVGLTNNVYHNYNVLGWGFQKPKK